MVAIEAATTVPVNKPGSKPLTRQQVWAGLIQKCLTPQKFVSVMSDCKVSSQTATEIIRTVTFREGMGPPMSPPDVEERVVLAPGVKADFYQVKSGSFISNIISTGPGGPDDLYLTFTFSFVHPGIEDPNSEEVHEKQKGYSIQGIKTVAHTIEVIREMVESGKI
ncbi:hypothetical protein MMC25_002200 [Agyrium rufum]|nr:hypothetical protein [Agyrium rufum]